ncbi:hypothetical protein BCV70DRAFT_201838 [Testicularia cyperi]|uniref:Transcription activator of gluconeogenesis ERT1 n=1 Tax=Testicularia cyperi TaxID=1882483 RepID=A0A317XJM5_9BASI|nr:hypothetical protein BCV70DRAFT_201838 [Testicularia cyperi]
MSNANPNTRPPTTASLPPPPSTTNAANRSGSPSQHAAASALASLARPSGSGTSPSSRPGGASQASPGGSSHNERANAAALLRHSLYSNSPSSSSPGSSNGAKPTGASSPSSSTKAPSKSPSGAGSPLKREIDVASSSASPGGAAPSASASPPKKDGEGSKRKKANRACSHCQKAHLTCDDSRPCQRCVKKGLQDSCHDGFRKKAKYLLDEDELEELRKQKEAKRAAKQAQQAGNAAKAQSAAKADTTQAASAAQSSTSTANGGTAPLTASSIVDQVVSAATPASSGHGPSPHHAGDFFSSSNFDASSNSEPTPSNTNASTVPPFDLSFDAGLHNFGSEATSLEYSILSSMLNGTDFPLLGANGGSPDFQTSPAVGVMNGWNIAAAQNGVAGLDAILNGSFGNETSNLLPGAIGMDTASATYSDSAGMSAYNGADAATGLSDATGNNGFSALEVPSPRPPMMDEPMPPPLLPPHHQQHPDTSGAEQHSTQVDLGSSSQRSSSNEPVTDINAAIASRRYARQQQDTIWRARIAKTYRDNTAPFPYPEGYHFLIKYVTSKFEKSEVLRIVRALAIFRPSLIALQMPLTEEDEIFVERALQRTMLEFEKLISFSGTPTVVWRRTCEICVVGAEFCMLTQWSREQLMGRRIYEFFDTNTTLDYWEKFALHAFENTTQSVMTTCTLVKPDGKPVPCAFCFTIKRDTFDLPSLIVGNFLPILS